ncbi:MAG: hypothetical protein ABII02_00230 [Candidatus Magasanikbacteria bacterium]
MKKFLFLASVCVLILTTTGCSLFGTEEVGNDNGEVIHDSMEKLLTKEKTLKCTVEETEDGEKVITTLYIDHEKMRADSRVSGGGDEEIDSHIISDGEWMYTWLSAEENGMKINIKEMEELGKKFENSEENFGDFDIAESEEKMDFNCKKWKVDKSVFIPPTDVSFNNMAAGLGVMLEGFESLDTNGVMESMCGLCDLSPTEEEKKECRVGLECK